MSEMTAPTVTPQHTLRRGDLAFYETIRSGMVPVKVKAIIRDGDELIVAVRVTADRGAGALARRPAYIRGEALLLRAGPFLHSRSAVRVTRTGAYITGRTVFVPDDEL